MDWGGKAQEWKQPPSRSGPARGDGGLDYRSGFPVVALPTSGARLVSAVGTSLPPSSIPDLHPLDVRSILTSVP